MKVKSESEVAQSCLTLSDPWTVAYQAPPSMGFSRQEYWSGVPLPSPLYKNIYVKIWKFSGLKVYNWEEIIISPYGELCYNCYNML